MGNASDICSEISAHCSDLDQVRRRGSGFSQGRRSVASRGTPGRVPHEDSRPQDRTSSKSEPAAGRFRANLGRRWPMLGRTCSNSGQSWPKSCQFRANAGIALSNLVDFGQDLVNPGQFSQNFVELGPILSVFGPILADTGPILVAANLAGSRGCSSRKHVDYGDSPRPARNSTSRNLARNRALRAGIQTTFRFSGSNFGRGADFQRPNTIRRIALGCRQATPWPNSEPEKQNAQIRALSVPADRISCRPRTIRGIDIL